MAQLRSADVERWVDSVTDMPPPRSDERDARAGDPGKERQLLHAWLASRAPLRVTLTAKTFFTATASAGADQIPISARGVDLTAHACPYQPMRCQRPFASLTTPSDPAIGSTASYVGNPPLDLLFIVALMKSNQTRGKYGDAVRTILEAVESGDFPRTNDPRLKEGGAGSTR
ncbi:unnamed protein product [Fusarium graminearum]|nr:unnamed protein product [Fusarium graminearum]